MDSDFLGVGITFPMELDELGKVKISRYEEAVRQSVWIILGTAPGERLMRPDFGCGIHNLVFAPNSAATIGKVVSEVTSALIEWEPRIDVLGVNAAPDDNQANLLLIQISYQVRTTNNRFNLVYPFYLA